VHHKCLFVGIYRFVRVKISTTYVDWQVRILPPEPFWNPEAQTSFGVFCFLCDRREWGGENIGILEYWNIGMMG
jgi:hypothetical protein